MLWQTQPAEGGSVGGTGELTPPPPPPQLPPQESPGSTVEPTAPGEVPVRKGTRASHVVLTAGGIALGLGAVLIGVGFASSNGVGIALGLTFGALLGIAGLITLIVGLILLAAGK